MLEEGGVLKTSLYTRGLSTCASICSDVVFFGLGTCQVIVLRRLKRSKYGGFPLPTITASLLIKPSNNRVKSQIIQITRLRQFNMWTTCL
jgi:hypothetical protein